MIKGLFAILTFFLIANIAKAQDDILVRSFYQKDSVYLKWLPQSFNTFKLGLKHGYKIERKSNEGTVKLGTILPFNERKTDIANQDLVALVNELLVAEEDEAIQVYNSLLIGSGPRRALAELLGLYFVDIDFKTNQQYTYEITVLTTNLKGEWSMSTQKMDEFQNLTELEGVSKRKLKEVYLKWNGSELIKDYSAYIILKSTDSSYFESINPTPWVYFVNPEFPDKDYLEYVDTNVIEGDTYWYKIQGINHFGLKGDFSNTIKIKVPISLYGINIIDTILVNEYERKILGYYRGKDKEVNEISHFNLLRSDSLKGPYEIVGRCENLKGQFNFSYQSNMHSGDRNYFLVHAIGKDGDTVSSYAKYFFTYDQIPPETPTGLMGEVNDSGVVSLTWDKAKELDIQGYRVYRSNALHEEFVEVTKNFALNGFKDTLALDNLTSQVFYKIRAVDKNYNNSPLTEAIELTKPDTIAPVSGIITKYKNVSQGINLVWVNSNSEDVKINYLTRKAMKTGVVDTIYSWSNTDTSLVDSLIPSPGDYYYSILTVDNSNNEAYSKPLQLSFEPGHRSTELGLSGAVDRESRQILLQWKPQEEEVYAVYIYRAKGKEGDFKLIDTVFEVQDSKYSDSDVSINNDYRYKIRIMFSTGHSSKMSEEVYLVF